MRRNEPVSKIMTATPVTVHTGMPLSEVQARMAENNCHHMPVVSGKNLVGMISSSDVLRVSYESDLKHASVLDHTRNIADVMASDVVTVAPKATVREVAEVFSKNWFHAMPVVDNDELVGIVTTTDIIKYLLDQY